MSILKNMTRFTDRMPPEGVDLFVVWDPDTEDREYCVARFFKKGALIEDEYRSQLPKGPEKLLDEILNHGSLHHPAEKTGYYMYHNDELSPVIWWPVRCEPLDSLWAVINPEDEA